MRQLVRIIRYSARLWPLYVVITVLVVIISVLNLATPFLLKFIVDAIVANLQGGEAFNISYLSLLVGLILVADVLVTLLDNVNGYIGDLLAAKLETLLSHDYYEHILSLPLEYYDNEITGRITSRLDRGITTITQLFQTLSNNFIQFFLTTLVTLIAVAYYSWQVSLLLFLLFPSYIALTQFSSKRWQKKQEFINQDIDEARGRFIEAVAQIRAVKAFVMEKAEARFFFGKRKAVEQKVKRQSKEWHWFDILRRLIMNFIFFGIFLYIVRGTFRGQFTLGELTLLVTLTNQARWPLFGSSFIIDQIQRAAAGSKDFFEVMNLRPVIQDHRRAIPLKVEHGEVEYREVDFAYKDAKQVLKGISFKVKPGQRVALVGESGEGKTTIANLLARFYDPARGQILIDGQDIAMTNQTSLRANIGIVFQDPVLFSGSVKANITYGTDHIDEQSMVEAAKAANAHDFIKKLPEGYDTGIGERGIKLSGGQKQRIAIARAILKDAPILILDEATSSLDSKAEREVQEALERLMEGRTTIIIAHRLSTIASVDLVVGIKAGRVAEMGSPDELSALPGGIYAELLALQSAPPKQRKELMKQYELAA